MFNCHLSSNNLYDSNPWRTLSDSAFASSQGSLSNCSQKDGLLHCSPDARTESPVHKIYQTYISKEPLLSKTNNESAKTLKDVNVTHCLSRETQNKAEIEMTSMVTFLFKELVGKIDLLSANVNQHLTNLKENLEENCKNSMPQDPSPAEICKRLIHEVRLSAQERSRIAELESVVKQKDEKIQMLEKQLEDFKDDGIQRVFNSLKSTFTSEIQTLLRTLQQSNSCHAQQIRNFEHRLDHSISSVKDVIIKEIHLPANNHKENTPSSFNALNELDVNHSNLQRSSRPANDGKRSFNILPHQSSSLRAPTDNIFEQLREEFDCPLQMVKTPSLPKPQKQKPRKCNIRSAPSKCNTPSLNPLRANLSKNGSCTKRTPLKLIGSNRPSRSLIGSVSSGRLSIWNYRSNFSKQVSDCSFDFSERADSISDESSPSYSIKHLTGAIPIVDISENDELTDCMGNIMF